MIQIDLDKLYWFTKLSLRLEGRRHMLPVQRRGSMALVVSIPKNDHGIPSGYYIAALSRAGGLIPVEGPYRTRMIAAVASVS
jgi:hypothetical protein